MPHQFFNANVYELPFEDESIDTIITDPPWHFELRIPKGKAVAATPYPLILDDEWRDSEKSLVFGQDEAGRLHSQTVDIPTPLSEMKRVLKPGGHLYIFCPERKLRMAMAQFPEVFDYFNTLQWVKTRKDGKGLRIGLGHTYRNAFESILCLSKGRRRPLVSRNVANVLFAPPEGGSVKPASLYATIARASTPQGGIILDPFAGSDPLGRARLEEFETISTDVQQWGTG